jgi:hypothetical protein
LNELFNFADGGFVRGSDRVQAFKLGRPAPKVSYQLFLLSIYYCQLLTCLCYFCRSEMLTGAQCMCHWHLGWRILRGKIRRRKTLLGVLVTPAVRRTRPAPSRPPRREWRGKGRWQQILRLRRRYRQRAAKRQSAVGSSGSPTTTTRRRRPHRRWSEGLVAVRTVHRPLLIGWPATLLRRALRKRGRRCRPAGLGGGSPRPIVDQTCECSTYVLWRLFLFFF